MNKDKINDFRSSLYMVGIGFVLILLLNCIVSIFIKDNTFNIFNKIFIYDAQWYNSIIENGYMPYALGDPNNSVVVSGGKVGMANWAFFPLIPLIIGILKKITFNLIGVEILSFIFSTTCYIFFVYNIIRYLKEKNIKINYFLLFAILIFNSIIMFFYTLYTESLTMLLIILLIRVCDNKKYAVGGLLCALLTAIKVQGCFWCIYLFVKIYQDLYQKKEKIFSSFIATIWEIVKKPYYLISLAISPLGLFAFLVVLNESGLSPLAFMDVQSGWVKESSFFIFTILKQIFIDLKVLGLLAIFFIGFAIYLFKNKKYLSASMLSMYIIVACTSSVVSIGRYIFGTVIFPLELYSILIRDIDTTKLSDNTKEKKGALFRLRLFYAFKIFVVIPCIIFFFITDRVPMY